MPTLTIQLTSLPVGATVFGPVNIGSNTEAFIQLVRTVAGGLNSLTAASRLDITIQTSADNGITWRDRASVSTNGGIFTTPHGTATTVWLDVSIVPGDNRARIMANVTGLSSIVVSGSLTVI